MNIIVIGAGAAGLIAAGQAAAEGAQVTLIEKNDRPGRKLMITGKGRCNITNTEQMPDFLKYIPGNGQFLYSSLSRFDNNDLINFFNEHGLETKIERGGRVFPVSDKAEDVVRTLTEFCLSKGVKFKYSVSVKEIISELGKVTAVRCADGSEYECDAAIVTTGGASYPGTGSTGDGYEIARRLGHTLIPLKPALVPLETKEEWVKEMQGLSLKNVEVSVLYKGKKTVSEFGEMIFTHFGVSGPIILTLSRAIVPQLDKEQGVTIQLDLKPALTEEQLDARVQRDFTKYARKQFQNSLDELLPKSMIPVMLKLSGIQTDKPVHQITREERLKLVELMKSFTLTVTRPRSIKEAIVTAGGVSIKEINPKTMESKLISGLYFAGEVVDVDAYTGGFNLQAAFSMGYVAGTSAAASYGR
ncbi:MAG TPA: NAD(P)/FAD-dependent oxidoreductase [Desulfobacteria bacterium]|nr:NAD(P)/FAD-dependent oxidoreductase [Desulfobacteria bacterium]